MKVKHLLISFALTFFALTSWSQELIYYWNFNSNTPATDTNWEQPIAATTGDAEITYTFSEAYSFGGTTINGVTGEESGGSFAPRGGVDMVNNGKDFILDIPTSGYSNISISFPLRRTSTGFTQIEVLYTLDGSQWTSKETIDITAWESSWLDQQIVSVDFTSITDVNSNANFKVKFVLTGSSSAVGNNRIDNIKVTGDVEGGVATPAITPDSQSFLDPFDATITCSTEGSTIYYTLDGNDPDESSTEYTGAINITGTTTLKARAYAADLSPSNIATAVYTLTVAQTTDIPYTEDFGTDLGKIYTYSVSGDTKEWEYYTSSQSAGINGYNSGELEEDWLILPGVTLNNDDVALKFDSWRKYGEDDASNYLKVMYSTDYEGIRDPSDATWTELTFNGPSEDEAWTTSGNIDLSEIVGDPVYIAFKYHYNVDMYVNWQVDNIYIGEPTINDQAEITSFVLSEQVGEAAINSENATVTVQVALGTDLTNLTPTIGLSSGATIEPASGVAQDFSEPVEYVVTAEDQTTEKTWTVTVSTENVTSIYEIQYTTEQSGDSPLIEQTVTTSGIVTSLHYNYAGGTYRGYFIQDSAKAWNGLYVFNNTNNPNVGDKIVVTGKIIEYYNVTEMSPVDEFEVISTGNPLPQPVVTSTLGANSEEWEGVLIQVKGATCTNADAGNGMVEVNDGTGALKVDDDVFDVVLTLNTKYDITGVGHYSYEEYKLLPRTSEDIEISTSTDVNSKLAARVYPNPFSNSIYVDNIQHAKEITVTSLIGQQLMNIPVSGKNILEIDTNELPAGIYLVTIRNEDGTRIVKKAIKR